MKKGGDVPAMRSRCLLRILALAGALALAGCASRSLPGTSTGVADAALPGLRAFEAICLKTAPDFAGAAEAARSFGIDRLDDYGFARMGMTADKSLGVQIKPGVECVTTTPGSSDRTLSRQFGETIARFAGGRPPGVFPVAAVVGGRPFIFHHDRNGGEAFVMLSQGGADKR